MFRTYGLYSGECNHSQRPVLTGPGATGDAYISHPTLGVPVVTRFDVLAAARSSAMHEAWVHRLTREIAYRMARSRPIWLDVTQR